MLFELGKLKKIEKKEEEIEKFSPGPAGQMCQTAGSMLQLADGEKVKLWSKIVLWNIERVEYLAFVKVGSLDLQKRMNIRKS